MLSRLRAGDELLEVNGRRLHGLKHFEVIRELKETPKHVRLVCARVRPEFAHAYPHASAAAAGSGSGPPGARVPPPLSKSKSEQESSASSLNGSGAPTSVLGTAGQGQQVRRKSGAGLAGSSLAEHVPRKPSRTVAPGIDSKRPSEASAGAEQAPGLLTASNKSRSLEPLNQLATWSSTPLLVELTKGERGLGFSILDHKVSTTTSLRIALMSAR